MATELQTMAVSLGQRLAALSQIMVTAESCTGGWVAKLLTDIPGSSDWFDCGFVTYSNSSKQQMLGVQSPTLATHGAVSEAVVIEMVKGALECSRAGVAVAISGIAGPGGGSPDQPVGTVWFAWQVLDRPCVTRRFVFSGDREAVRRQAALQALQGMLALVNQRYGRPTV